MENVAAQVAAAHLSEPGGSKNLFHYQVTPYDPGSDHDIFNDSTVGVPALMLGHWPDWTHHTSEDTLDKVDPTTLKRVGVLATAAALWLATAHGEQWALLAELSAERLAGKAILAGTLLTGRKGPLSPRDYPVAFRAAQSVRALQRILESIAEQAQPIVLPSLARIQELLHDISDRRPPASKASPGSTLVPQRLFIGPLADSYASMWFQEQLGEDYLWWREQAKRVPHWEILVYETLNFTDGKRSLAEIEGAVRAEFGEVPEGVVEHILRDLEKVGLVEFHSSPAE